MVHFAIAGSILSADYFRLLSPNVAVPARLASYVLLIVNDTEEVVPEESHEHQDGEGPGLELVWVGGEILSLQCVDEW